MSDTKPGLSPEQEEDLRFLARDYAQAEESSNPVPNHMTFGNVPLHKRRHDQTYLQGLDERIRAAQDRSTGPPDSNNPSWVGKIVERLVRTEINRSRWFGACYAIRITRYDDHVNGVDAVLEWEREGSEAPVRLAVDITVSSAARTVNQKLGAVRMNAEVRYFRSKAEQVFGKPKDLSMRVPLAILGIDLHSLIHMAHEARSRVVEGTVFHRDGTTCTGPRLDPDTFARHPVCILLHGQILAQLEHLLDHCIVRAVQQAPANRQTSLLPLRLAAERSHLVAVRQISSGMPPTELERLLGTSFQTQRQQLAAIRAKVLASYARFSEDEIASAAIYAGPSYLHHRLTHPAP